MRYALSISVVAIVLSACGGSSALAPAGIVNDGVRPLLKSKTFHYSGTEQVFKVPDGVSSITIVARGAQGGGKNGGLGGRVYAEIPVLSGDEFFVLVGGKGIKKNGGFNGGGKGGQLYGHAYGGGGASDIRGPAHDHLTDRIIIAGGGGGEGEAANSSDAPDTYYYAAYGGKGGAGTGGTGQAGWPGKHNGYDAGGGGGDGGGQYNGGLGGYGGTGSLGTGQVGHEGVFGEGGLGGALCYANCTRVGEAGGGGGGGYYGGGGGGAGGASSSFAFGGGGGGGGSSYIEPKAKKFQSWQGWKNAIGDGLVVISWK